MKFNRLAKRVALAALGLLAANSVALAESVADFYHGKTITLSVGAAAGGTADALARAFAPYFQQHIPGHPNIIVVNKPGAGGLVEASSLAKMAPKDGTEIGFVLGNDLSTPHITGQDAQFDPRKVQWLGAIENGHYPYALYAYKSAPVKSADDIFKKKMVIGATSYTQYNRIFPTMLDKYAGAKFHVVSGYKGSGEIYLAMERGEVGGWFEGSATLREPIGVSGQLLKDGKMHAILLMAAKKSKDFPDMPIAIDYIKDPAQRKIAEYVFEASAVGRPLAVPAGVPEDRVAALRKAFHETFADPAFAPAMLKKDLIAREQTPAEIQKFVSDFYAAPKDELAAVRSLVMSR